jgi:predicted Ser/Thr protein kinase
MSDARLDADTERGLIEWIEARLAHGRAARARGYQGAIYVYGSGARRFAVKVAAGRGWRGYVRRWMLRRESAVYRRLSGFPGSPRCYGLLRGRYLVLDYVDGVPLRGAALSDRERFFGTLLAHILELHRRGVAHADLKRRDNLLVVGGDTPCLIDFGAAIVRKPGFAPLNHYLYALARRFDLNAWAKLKYDGRYQDMTPEDRVHFRRTVIERVARALKRTYLGLKRRFRGLEDAGDRRQ